MRLVYQVEDDYADAARSLEERYSSYLTPEVNPPEGIPAEVLTYFPYDFPGDYPLLAVSEIAPEPGSPALESDTTVRLRALRTGVRIYHPSIILNEELPDARETAKRITRAIFSNWLAAFQADEELDESAYIASITMGDRNVVGEYHFQANNPNNILWVHATEVVNLL